jgi:putative mRNA 3-end processing factor
MTAVETWLMPTAAGLYCAPGDFYIDPPRKVARALITHGHSDHARAGHGHVLATAETIAIMQVRYGRASAGRFEAVHLGRPQSIHGVSVRFVPAGHILGSAQIVLEWAGKRVVVSGDYKRAADPTCLPFELVPCDVFVTEATFALPVFRHGPVEAQIDRLLRSMAREPGRAHLVGAYGLGKCQRLLKVLRQAGYDRPIYLHDTHVPLTQLYEHLGQHFGDVRRATDAPESALRGALAVCPPTAFGSSWCARFGADPVTAFASGWMRVRARARQAGVDLPLVISDHADWPELIDTIVATAADDVWITHGRDDALVHALAGMGRRARALSLVGREEEAD